MAMHRLPGGPGGHSQAPWRQVVALGLLVTLLVLVTALLTRPAWGWNTMWLTLLVPALMWFGMSYIAGRGGGGYAPREEPEPDDTPTLRMAAVEANPPAAGPDSGDHGAGRDLDRPAARHALIKGGRMTKPSPVPRNPAQAVLSADRFAPYTVPQVEAAALALQTTRWNFTLIKKLQPHQAAKQFDTMNRYLREQVLKEAHAALKAAEAPVWPTEQPEPEVPAGARDDAAEVDDFWNRQMERLIDWFNPPDEDAACESIVLDAIERAYKFAEAQPCTCAARAGDVFDACQRCQVLGRIKDEAVQR